NFKKLAPTTDDLWFKESSYRLGVKVTVIPEISNMQASINMSSNLALNGENTGSISRRKANNIVGIINRVLELTKAYFGVNLYKNDEAYKNIKKYSEKSY